MDDKTTCTYDVFIAYADADEPWVREELLPQLRDTPLRICTHWDFRPGAPRKEEIKQVVEESKKTLLVLTRAYFESEWNAYVDQMVETLDPASRDLRLIPLLREKCDVPLDIRRLTYIDFTDPENQEYAWRQLLTALGVPPAPEPPALPTRDQWHLAHPYPMPPHFTGRDAERTMLSQWLASDSVHPLLLISALGGFGKSALAWHWLLHDVDPGQWPRVVWWSFYEGEANFESFLLHIMAYLGTSPSSLPSHEWVEYIATLMHQQGILIIMDGFERALRAYSTMNAPYQGDSLPDQGPGGKSLCGDRERQRDCVSPLAELFLKGISSLPGIQGKVLMTTRLRPRILEAHGNVLLHGCREEELKQMHPDDAVSFFYAQGIRGTRAEIQGACEPYGYHPLSLRLLAGLIVSDLQQPGDITVAGQLDISGDLVQRRHHVLEQAYETLIPVHSTLLCRIACFRGPVGYEALAALGKDTCPSVDEGLRDLLSRNLIHRDRTTNRFDLHPIVRSYAYDRLSQKERTASHTRMRDYFSAVPPPRSIKTLVDLAPVIELYHHTVRAGMYDEAWKIFYDRISKPTYYQLGAYNLRIELLCALFPDGEEGLPRLKEVSAQSWTLIALANTYCSSGQPRKGVGLYEKANAIVERLGDIKNLSIGLGILAYMVQLPLGMLREVEQNLRYALALSQKIDDKFQDGIGLQELGRVLTYRGEWSESEKALSRALELFVKEKHIQSQGVIWAYRALRALLLARTQFAGKGPVHKGKKVDLLNKEALDAAQKALELADETARTRYHVEHDFVRAHWLLGAVYLSMGNLKEADRHLGEALTRCRRINMVYMEADILMGCARVHRAKGNREDALRCAQDALVITERSEYRLQGADVHLLLAELAQDVADKESAISHAKRGLELATCDGPPDYTYKAAYEEAHALLAKIESI